MTAVETDEWGHPVGMAAVVTAGRYRNQPAVVRAYSQSGQMAFVTFTAPQLAEVGAWVRASSLDLYG